MSIKRALDSILEGNLDEMRQNFSSALTTKAVEKLEERKIEIAKNYFGQVQEEKVDESVAALLAGTAAGGLASYGLMKSGLLQKGVEKTAKVASNLKNKLTAKKKK